MAKVYPAKVHIVLDLETLSLDSHAAIIDIGAVVAYGNFQTETFSRAIKPSNYMGMGTSFTVEDETISFHEEKNSGYLEKLEAEGVGIQEAASEFAEWLKGYASNAELHVWSQGKDFDFPVLANLFRFCGVQHPYKYRNVHCVRDLLFLNPKARIGTGSSAAHTALADAIFCKDQFQAIVASNGWYQKLFV